MMQSIETIDGFVKRNKRALWVFKLENNFCVPSELVGYEFNSQWLQIDKVGTIEIRKGYVWDGCTFKKSVLDIFIVGTPDGIIDIETLKPKTCYASLVHDALYQYYGYHGVRRRDIDRLFLTMMRKKKFKPALLYYLAVRVFGGLFFCGRKRIRVDGKVYFKDYWEKKQEQNPQFRAT